MVVLNNPHTSTIFEMAAAEVEVEGVIAEKVIVLVIVMTFVISIIKMLSIIITASVQVVIVATIKLKIIKKSQTISKTLLLQQTNEVIMRCKVLYTYAHTANCRMCGTTILLIVIIVITIITIIITLSKKHKPNQVLNLRKQRFS